MYSLKEKSFEELLDFSNKLDAYIESCDVNSDEYKRAKRLQRDCGYGITDKVEETVIKAKKLNESGIVNDAYLEEVYDEMQPLYDKGIELAVPYYTESVVANALHIASAELAALSSKMFAIMPKSEIGDVLTLPVKKFIMKRLSRYPLLYPDAVSFKQLTSEMYTIDEVKNKFNIKTDFAEKWQISGRRTNCKMYSYNKKPVMCIFYTKNMKEMMGDVNVEVEFLDSKFKKHDDYYVACMATQIQLSHPASARVLKKMKSRWETESKKQKKAIQESAADAEINGTIDEKISLIEEAVERDLTSKEAANEYIAMIKKSEFKEIFD